MYCVIGPGAAAAPSLIRNSPFAGPGRYMEQIPRPESDDAAWFAIPLERWYVEVAEANPHRCRHRGPCGTYFLCDREVCQTGGYQRVELLHSGQLLFHCEGLSLDPNDPRYRKRRAGLSRREDLS